MFKKAFRQGRSEGTVALPIGDCPRCRTLGQAPAFARLRREPVPSEPLSDATCLREALRRRQGTQLEDFFNILLMKNSS